jgi:predicted SnoaL-like aldol condensation-catalyzing enzyme
MKILNPSRLIAAVSLSLAALSFGVAYAGAGSSGTPPQGAGQACVHGTALLERNKKNVVTFYETAVNDKNPRLAVQLYGGDEYIQHNPLADNGFDAFIAFFEGFEAAFPNLNIDIRRVIAECDLVVTHGIIGGAGTEAVFGPRGSKVVDIFRLDANGKIVEHWDVLAAISATSANGNPEV